MALTGYIGGLVVEIAADVAVNGDDFVLRHQSAALGGAAVEHVGNQGVAVLLFETAAQFGRRLGCGGEVFDHAAFAAGFFRLPAQLNADMAQRFGVPVGLSDHTLDNTTAIAAVALGACVIEKHFTLDRNGGGPDDSFSLEPQDLAELCRSSHTAWQALGQADYGLKSSEQGNIQFRRSLYFVKDMKAGDTIGADCIRSVRPGYGLAPKHYDALIGKRLRRDVAANTATDWDCVEE